MFKLYIDADGCPVVRQAVSCANQFSVECVLVCDFSHQFQIPEAAVITVEKGADSADFKLVNLIRSGDIVVTQDYGLAAMCLGRNAVVLNQNGLLYNSENIDSLLLARHTARKIRASGGRLKGPSKRTSEQDAAFLHTLTKILTEKTHAL